MPDTYEFRISGQLSHDLLASFEPQMSSCEADETVFVRLIEDSGELFGVIARCELLGLRLVGLRQLRSVEQVARLRNLSVEDMLS